MSKWCSAFLLANLFDGLSTLFVLSRGAVEFNPFMRWLLTFGLDFMFTTKLMLGLAITFVALALGKDKLLAIPAIVLIACGWFNIITGVLL